MIGFYDYTIVLTLLSLVTSIFGMTQAMDGHFRIAIFCLALSGLFDTFDGKVARTKKNRTDDEKLYGIQLDSLADVVCFGVFPVMICYLMGVRGVLGGIALGFYSICGVIRLAYFNVLETNRQMQPTGEEKVYHGLPITSIAVILPLTFLAGFAVSDAVFHWMLFAMLLIVGLCFILDFKMRKPKNWMLAVLILLVGCTVVTIILFAEHRVSRSHEIETPLYDQIEEWADE
jgi:CDP-diacylglycerol--serine O-phosphatidyltransferase